METMSKQIDKVISTIDKQKFRIKKRWIRARTDNGESPQLITYVSINTVFGSKSVDITIDDSITPSFIVTTAVWHGILFNANASMMKNGTANTVPNILLPEHTQEIHEKVEKLDSLKLFVDKLKSDSRKLKNSKKTRQTANRIKAKWLESAKRGAEQRIKKAMMVTLMNGVKFTDKQIITMWNE